MNNNIYEIGFLINQDLAQQGAEKTVDNVRNIIGKADASVISEGEIVDIDLAYQITTKIASKNERFNKAYFTWVKFESEPGNLSVIKSEIDKIKKEIFRYLIIKTVKDDEETDKYLSSLDEEESESKVEENKTKDLTDKEVNETPKPKEEKVEETKEEEEVKETEEVKEEETSSDSDDLTKIEGIGPKTAEALNSKGIKTYADLADSKVGDLRDILEENSLSRYDPKTWSKQSRLARDEKWDDLKELQESLDGGE